MTELEEKIEACPTCKTGEIRETKRTWEETYSIHYIELVGYYSCNNCDYTYTQLLKRELQ